MRRQTDVLVGGIFAAAALVVTLAPVGGASFQFSAGEAPAFPESYLLTLAPASAGPSPATFQALKDMGRVVVGQYEVRPQDTLASIAATYGSTADYLRSTNHLESTKLPPGKTLLVHSGKGMLYQVREKKGRSENLRQIAQRYNRSAVEIARANRLPGVALLGDFQLADGSVLFLPGVRLRFTDYMVPVAWVPGKRMISSGFGVRRHPLLRTRRFHTGLDMPRPYGFPVKASREGTVIFCGWRGGYGKLVIIKHQGGLRTWYGHLSQIDVTEGQRVAKGHLVGRVGATGLATGPHLHFEVRDRFGNSLNPKKFIF
ncbi:MAG TPA: M23 family metallopeptidase [Elusimicrobiota bacterium]|nr:M23 family metallopeptidase [Elusimicrobiota bacterium]HMX42530.1 M23 family metallopeptidase [Elusimicrobiota bacterium]